ncbi:hypothetical protein B0H11DRAFT_1930404 [Mycena galericulata]|nr:hypothetical protein B0H11DRAFT_1930404 [Mycena galericulata]
MNSAFPAGTRIFYWNGAGQTVYGTVQRAARAADGTVVLEIRLDATGGIITLPFCALKVVTDAACQAARITEQSELGKADLPFPPTRQVTGSRIPRRVFFLLLGTNFIRTEVSQVENLTSVWVGSVIMIEVPVSEVEINTEGFRQFVAAPLRITDTGPGPG